MRSPLCVVKLMGKDGRSFWRPSFSAATCRGMHPLVVVYLRFPSEQERAIVEEHLCNDDVVFYLDDLVQRVVFGRDP